METEEALYQKMLDRHAEEVAEMERKITEAKSQEDYYQYERLMHHYDLLRQVHAEDRRIVDRHFGR